jgi:hypothetical protein
VPQRRDQVTSDRRKANGVGVGTLAGTRALRWVDTPPLSGSLVGPFNYREPAISVPKRALTTAPSRTAVTSHNRRWHRLLPARCPVKQWSHGRSRAPMMASSMHPKVAARVLPTRCTDLRSPVVNEVKNR